MAARAPIAMRLAVFNVSAISAHMRRTDERSTLLHNLIHLQDLALDEIGDDARASEQEVPAEDGVLVPKRGRRGRRPATQVRAADHVVVQERRRIVRTGGNRQGKS
jgi:hypothetical protein